MADYPTEHLEDAQKLEADGYVHLYEIELKTGSKLFLKMDNDVTWQGNTYEGTFITLTGIGKSADEETARPRLTIANPDGIFSPLIRDGELNRAKITRIRVLKAHLDADMNISRRETWRISRPISVNRVRVQFEVRSQLDGQFFLVPGRMFIPPEFPQVSLT